MARGGDGDGARDRSSGEEKRRSASDIAATSRAPSCTRPSGHLASFWPGTDPTRGGLRASSRRDFARTSPAECRRTASPGWPCAGCRARSTRPPLPASHAECPLLRRPPRRRHRHHLVERVLGAVPPLGALAAHAAALLSGQDSRLLSEVLSLFVRRSSPSSGGQPCGSGCPGHSPALWPSSSASAQRSS